MANARKDHYMNSNRSSQSGLTLRLSVIGVPTYSILPFVELLNRWSTCSGEEWTVKRCKSLKLALIQLRSGSTLTVPLARNRKGQIKGVVGSLMRWALKSDKNFSKVLNSFMVYSHWTSVILTDTQRKKFLIAINAEPVAIPVTFKRVFEHTLKAVVRGRTIRGKPQSLVFYRGSPSKRAPTVNQGSVPQSQKLLSELYSLDNDATWEHVRSLWDDIYCHVLRGFDVNGFCDSVHIDDNEQTPMVGGEVHFLQEPGYKLRSIASPFRLFQVASQPLKDDLSYLVRTLDWDCTYDQGKAFPYIQKHLAAKRQVYSVDLTSATDMFPYELQEIVLSTIYGKDNPYVKLFRDVSRSTWHSELGELVWRKGQPLGFNPSFFTFTLTHGLVLLTLLGKKYDYEFFVLGDDVIILNKELFEKYTSFLNEMGCPYSPEKTLVSSELAEFAGKVITKETVYPQLKWRRVSDNNFLDLARLIGPRIRLLLTKKQNEVLDVFSHIPNFIHPLGLNWSYPGSNLENMIKAGLELSFKERVLDSLTGLSKHTHDQLYADYGPFTDDLLRFTDKVYLKQEVLTFDEKVKSVFLRLGYARRNYEYFLENLKDIPLALSGLTNPELPLAEVLPSRVTLRQRLSRFIQKDKSS
jgi:hypothetical protein